MSPRLAQYGLLWRSALAQAHPLAHRAWLWLAPILTLAVATLAWFAGGPAAACRWGLNTVCGVTLLTWTWAYVPGAFRLNTPANAQLTPGMRARLQELGMALWLVCVVGVACANAGSASGSALVAAWFMIASLGMALAAAGSGAGTALLFAIWPLMGLQSFIPRWAHLAMAHPAFLPLLAAVLVLPALATVRTILPRAGERHWRLLEQRKRLRGKDLFGNREGSPFQRWWRSGSLRRASGRRQLGAMLLLGSGPNLQLGGITLGIGAMGLLGLGLLAFVRLSGHPRAAQLAVETGWLWSLLPLLLFQMHALMLASLTDTPAGQPLLRLAPAMPGSAPRFNRLLASTLLRSSSAAWAMAAATALVCAALSGAGPDALLMVACLSGLALPALLLPLRDHARRPRWNPVLQWLLVLALAGACLLAVLLVRWALPLPLALPVFAVAAALAVALTACLALRRCRLLARAPFAFPAGRLD